jgi:hypothetical protein
MRLALARPGGHCLGNCVHAHAQAKPAPDANVHLRADAVNMDTAEEASRAMDASRSLALAPPTPSTRGAKSKAASPNYFSPPPSQDAVAPAQAAAAASAAQQSQARGGAGAPVRSSGRAAAAVGEGRVEEAWAADSSTIDPDLPRVPTVTDLPDLNAWQDLTLPRQDSRQRQRAGPYRAAPPPPTLTPPQSQPLTPHSARSTSRGRREPALATTPVSTLRGSRDPSRSLPASPGPQVTLKKGAYAHTLDRSTRALDDNMLTVDLAHDSSYRGGGGTTGRSGRVSDSGGVGDSYALAEHPTGSRLLTAQGPYHGANARLRRMLPSYDVTVRVSTSWVHVILTALTAIVFVGYLGVRAWYLSSGKTGALKRQDTNVPYSWVVLAAEVGLGFLGFYGHQLYWRQVVTHMEMSEEDAAALIQARSRLRCVCSAWPQVAACWAYVAAAAAHCMRRPRIRSMEMRT